MFGFSPWMRRYGASILWFVVVLSAVVVTAINRAWLTWAWLAVLCGLVGYVLLQLKRS